MKFCSALLSRLSMLLLCSALGNTVVAQQPARWFQIEVSVFSNENPADRNAELWRPDRAQLRYPPRTRRLQELLDLLMIEDLVLPQSAGADFSPNEPAFIPPSLEDGIRATGPFPAKPAGDFRFYDFDRDSYVLLPLAASNFQQTNRAIDRSSDHRLLYHGLWRQPVVNANNATPILVQGGELYGAQRELQGSLTIRFNDNADRVVVDADLWLSEFSIVGDAENEWSLPPIPAALRRTFDPTNTDSGLDYRIRRSYRLKQSRDMRSTEFHYVDHPALGFVIMVQPYEVPAVPVSNPGQN